MARRVKMEEIEEIDRVEGQPHPRETPRLVGQGEALARAARAIRSGRSPQGWLISGPPGVGKATLAYRIARYLLRYGATAEGPEDLSVPDKDPVAMQVAAASHPGLLVLKRGISPNTGKPMTVLNVDEVRKLVGFFGLTSGAGGWRVAIVDTADDMNDNAANALLKALEEPPPRAMLILIANAPGRLLPTIRSRCQRLDLKPLSEAELAGELAARLPDVTETDRISLAHLAGGSLGLVLRLGSGDGLALARAAEQLIGNARAPDYAAIFTLADKLVRVTDGLGQFGEFLIGALTERVLARAAQGGTALDRWVELRERLLQSFARTSALNLEPRQTMMSAAYALNRTARHGGL